MKNIVYTMVTSTSQSKLLKLEDIKNEIFYAKTFKYIVWY